MCELLTTLWPQRARPGTPSFVSAVGVLVAVLSLIGCGGPSYVNIPAQKGDLALHGGDLDSVRAAVTLSVREVIRRTPLRAPVILTMPEGSDALTVQAISDRLDHPTVTADAAGSASNNEAARVTVDAVRIRANQASVDLYRAQAGSAPTLVTVHLTWLAGRGWGVERVRTWKIGVPEEAI